MKMYKYIRLCFILTIFIIKYSLLSAQEVFITHGKIEFEKKINVYKNMEDGFNDDEDKSWLEQLKKMSPEWNTTYFDLYFDSSTTLYKPGREVTEVQKTPDWFKGPATDNIVYHNLPTDVSISQKKVYETMFLLQDSSRHVPWKFSNDHRDIAGFDCRKASAVIMDSLFVVAFYTDQIITPGGPESFCGLPGMILGLAIPRLHTTWFATKIEFVPVTPQQLAAPLKGKKVSDVQLAQQLEKSMKDWGKQGKRNQWRVML